MIMLTAEDIKCFWACKACNRIITGALEVRACSEFHLYCGLCTPFSQNSCGICNAQLFTSSAIIEEARRLYHATKSCIFVEKSSGVRGYRINEIHQKCQKRIAEEIASLLEKETVQSAVHSDSQGEGANSSLAQRPETKPPGGNYVYCNGWITEGQEERCGECGRVDLTKVRFNRQKFLSTKWQCRCGFRNVLTSNKCASCGTFRMMEAHSTS